MKGASSVNVKSITKLSTTKRLQDTRREKVKSKKTTGVQSK